MAEIALTRGKVAVVDSEDIGLLRRHKWIAVPGKSTWYAHTSLALADRRVTVKMHRMILGITDAQVQVDHVDRNGLNNQRGNLRIATRSQNRGNIVSAVGASPYKGVHPRGDLYWTAKVANLFLGFYDSETQAALAYDQAALSLFGEFALLNFPDASEADRADAAAARHPAHADKSHCPKGHPYSGENLFYDSDGRRRCRDCTRAKAREWARANRQRRKSA